MPFLIPVAVAAAVGAAGAVATGLIAGTAITLGAVLASAAVSGGLALVSTLTAPRPKAPELRERTLTVRNAIAPRRLIYGRARVGGVVVFLDSTPSTNAVLGVPRNTFLTVVVALAGHKISQVEQVWLDDEPLTLDGNGEATAPARYVRSGTRLVRVEELLGADDQVASQMLIDGSEGKWTANHRLRGIAALNVRLRWNADAFTNGVPNITAIVRGREVFDPRTSATAYSANPALCIRDYLLLPRERGGAGFAAADLDDASFIAAANICDEPVTLREGGTEPRYEMHGTVELSDSNTPANTLPQMLSSCAGKLVWQGGKFRLIVGAWRAPVVEFGADDLAGPVQVATEVSRRDRFNAIRGTFINPADKWQPGEFPAVEAPTDRDGGERIARSVDLGFTISPAMAQRLAKIELLRVRQPITVSATWKLTAIRAQVGDVVTLSLERFGWSAKAFEVMEWRFAVGLDGGIVIDMTLRETDASIYDWTTDEQSLIDPAPGTSLPSPFLVAPVGLALSEARVISADNILTKLVATLQPEADAFVDRYEVQWRAAGETTWRAMGEGAGGVFEASGVLIGAVYEVRARAVNWAGSRSEWTQAAREILPRLTPPADVTGVVLGVSGDLAVLSWQPVADAELSHYAVRYSPNPTATWGDMLDVTAEVVGTSVAVQTRAGSYAVRAVTVQGLASASPTFLRSTLEGLADFNAVEIITESPDFDGAKTNVEVSGSALVLTAGETSGVYEFDQSVDLGQVYTSRVILRIETETRRPTEDWDDAPGLFDARGGLIDGTVDSGGNVVVEVSTTDDDPAGTPTWSAYVPVGVGDVTARALRFRAILTSIETGITPAILSLEVEVDMPDRVAGDNDILSDVNGTTITYSPAFNARPAVAITGYDLATGDYHEVTASTRAGFTVRFFNSADAGVARRFDWIAQGYGREE
jgi:hypothetical protein